jgi:hypothetical protein
MYSTSHLGLDALRTLVGRILPGFEAADIAL